MIRKPDLMDMLAMLPDDGNPVMVALTDSRDKARGIIHLVPITGAVVGPVTLWREDVGGERMTVYEPSGTGLDILAPVHQSPGGCSGPWGTLLGQCVPILTLWDITAERIQRVAQAGLPRRGRGGL